MENLKPMPEREKYRHVLTMVDMYHKHVLPFVESHLGYEHMHNLRSIWQAAIAPIHESDSDDDKYVRAHSNWLWVARCSHNELAEQLSKDQVIEYKRLLLRLYKGQIDTSNLFILRLLKANTAIASALLYQMQWMTEIEITSANRSEVMCTVHECKVLKIPGTVRICRVDCQNVGSAYARKLFNINRTTVLSNHGCTITLTPMTTEN